VSQEHSDAPSRLEQAPPRPAVFGRDITRSRPVAVRAEGIRVWDREGREYLDAASGAVAVISIGHGRQEVAERMAAQAGQLAYVHGGLLQHEISEQLAQALLRLAPAGITRVSFFSGGSEANEAALKLARQYHVVRGEPERQVVLSRRRSYHGMTLGALAVSGYELRRRHFTPLLLWEPAVVEPYCYRCPLGLTWPACDLACADDLERAILETGPAQVAAFIAEPIVAAAGPGITPPEGYYERIRTVCDRYGVLFIADEVVTGIGKTGLPFGIDHWGVTPDIITTAKGLSGGYAPLSALLIAGHVAEAFESRGVPFVHGHTYMEHPVSCAAGLAVLEIIEREDLIANAARQGAYLQARLRDLAVEEPLIGEVRGKGLLAGVELVADQATRAPFDPALGITQRLLDAARAHGLLLYPGQSGDGVASDQVLVSPPLVVSREEIDLILDRFALALDDIRAYLAEKDHATV
jgi:adenosylmethionine-8-amino-7-oxononanoate aminotransferase